MSILEKILKLGKGIKLGCSDESITYDVVKSRTNKQKSFKNKSFDYDRNITKNNDGILDIGSKVGRSQSCKYPPGLKNLIFDKAESKAIDIIGTSQVCSTSSSLVSPKILKGHSLSRYELKSSLLKSAGSSGSLMNLIHPSYLPSSLLEITKKLSYINNNRIIDNLPSTSQTLPSTSSVVKAKSHGFNQEAIFSNLRKKVGWEQNDLTDIGCKLWLLAIIFTSVWWSFLPPELIKLGKLKYLCDWELIGALREKELPLLSSRDVDIRVLLHQVQINFDPVQFKNSFDPMCFKPLSFNPLNLKIGDSTPGIEDLRVLKEAQLQLKSELTQQSARLEGVQNSYTNAGAMVFGVYLVTVLLIIHTIDNCDIMFDAHGSPDIFNIAL